MTAMEMTRMKKHWASWKSAKSDEVACVKLDSAMRCRIEAKRGKKLASEILERRQRRASNVVTAFKGRSAVKTCIASQENRARILCKRYDIAT